MICIRGSDQTLSLMQRQIWYGTGRSIIILGSKPSPIDYEAYDMYGWYGFVIIPKSYLPTSSAYAMEREVVMPHPHPTTPCTPVVPILESGPHARVLQRM